MKFQMLRGTAAALPILNEGELAYCLDTNQLWIGNGQQNMLIGDPTMLEKLKTVNLQLVAANKAILDQIERIKDRLDEIGTGGGGGGGDVDPNPPIGDKIDAYTFKGRRPDEFVYLGGDEPLQNYTADVTPLTAPMALDPNGIDADTFGGRTIDEFVFIGK